MEIKINLYLDHIVDDYFTHLRRTAKDAASPAAIESKVKTFRQGLKMADMGEYIKIITVVNNTTLAHSFILKNNLLEFKAMDIFEPNGWHEPNLKFSVGSVNDRSTYKYKAKWGGV